MSEDVSQSSFLLILWCGVFFFFSATFNKAIDALFHPQRDGSISCVSASDPCYLLKPYSELNLMH